MNLREAIFFLLLAIGLATSLRGIWLTRTHWRSDIPPYSKSRFIDVMLHPERFAPKAPLTKVRALNTIGGLFLAGALAVALWEIALISPRH
jgi:hypothetical protein